MKPQEPTKVVKALPIKSRNELYHTVDGYDFIYEHSDYTKLDVAKPGFFNQFRDELQVGMVVECRLGQIGDGITQLFLQVIASPKEGVGDVMVSVGPARKFTPVRHDGTLADDKEKAA